MSKQKDNRSTSNSVGPDDLAFNGQAGTGYSRGDNRYSGNYSGLTMRENFGNGPRMASENSQASMHGHGPSATKDSYRTAPATAKGGPVTGKTEVKRFKNPDSIYMDK